MEKKVIDVASARYFLLRPFLPSFPFPHLALPRDGDEASGMEDRGGARARLLFPSPLRRN